MAEAARAATCKVGAGEQAANTAVIPRDKEAVPEAVLESIMEIRRDKREDRESEQADTSVILQDAPGDRERDRSGQIMPITLTILPVRPADKAQIGNLEKCCKTVSGAIPPDLQAEKALGSVILRVPGEEKKRVPV